MLFCRRCVKVAACSSIWMAISRAIPSSRPPIPAPRTGPGPSRRGRCPHRGQRTGRHGACRATVAIPWHPHGRGRPARDPAAGGSGRRRRVPHGRDVRGLRPGPEAGRARPTGSTRRRSGARRRRTGRGSCAPAACRTPRTACRVSARHRQPGAHAAVPARLRAPVADAARARLRLEFVDAEGRWRRRASGRVTLRDVASGADKTIRAQVRRRLRRRAQQRARGHRRRSCAATSPTTPGAWSTCSAHRLPGHPAQGRRSSRPTRATSC